MQRDRRSIEVRSQEMSCHSVILSPPEMRLAETEFFSGFLQNAFQDFPKFEKFFCSVILLTARQTVESEQEKSERRYDVVKG